MEGIRKEKDNSRTWTGSLPVNSRITVTYDKEGKSDVQFEYPSKDWFKQVGSLTFLIAMLITVALLPLLLYT